MTYNDNNFNMKKFILLLLLVCLGKASEEDEKRNSYCGQLNLALEALTVGAGSTAAGVAALKGVLYSIGFSSTGPIAGSMAAAL